MKVWAIKAWNETFENAASRKLKRLDYFPFPTDRGSIRFKVLMQSPEGGLAYGHFVSICQYAATLPCRGLLFRSGRALSIEHIAIDIGIPVELLRRSWAVLSSEEPGWLYEVEVGSSAHLPNSYPSPTTPNKPPNESATDPPPIRHASASGPPPKAGRQNTCQEIHPVVFSETRERAGSSSNRSACLPGMDLRTVLAGLGVEDPALTQIVASGRIEAAEVQEAWAQLMDGTKRAKNPVRDPARALTAALCKRAGITLRTAGHVGVALMRQNEQFLRLRANRGASA